MRLIYLTTTMSVLVRLVWALPTDSCGTIVAEDCTCAGLLGQMVAENNKKIPKVVCKINS